MPRSRSILLPGDPDPAIHDWFEWIEHLCLIALLVVPAASLAASVILVPGEALYSDLHLMRPESLIATVLSTFSLTFSESGKPKWMLRLSAVLGAAVTAMAALVLLKQPFAFVPTFATVLANAHGLPADPRMTTPSAVGFGALGCALIFMTMQNRLAVLAADLLALCACVSTFTLVSGHIFGRFAPFGSHEEVSASPATLLCLFLLTMVAVLRRTGSGILSIFAESGTAGRLARRLAPVLLTLPFLREAARARILGAGHMPAHYVTALLASLAAIVSLAALLYFVWKIHGMETEIHLLTLRDELTGLHNLRGFQMLADQALRQAHRAKKPFSVLFVDVDDLKIINDSLGHQAGSELLVETAEILRTTFRGIDVVGRLGGDEFAVAGQLSRAAIVTSVERLQDSCAKRNAEDGRPYHLSFSVGYAVSDGTRKAPLSELLAKADEAMYESKRSKKEAGARVRFGNLKDESSKQPA